MEQLRGWAASLIAAAVLAGVTEFVLPKSRFEKSFKALIALFMLVAFLSPLAGLTARQEQVQSGLDELLEEHEAQRALEKTVKETLESEIISSVTAFAAEEGIALHNVSVKISMDNDHIIAVERIVIIMDGTAQERQAMDDHVFRSYSVHPILQLRESHEDEAA